MHIQWGGGILLTKNVVYYIASVRHASVGEKKKYFVLFVESKCIDNDVTAERAIIELGWLMGWMVGFVDVGR